MERVILKLEFDESLLQIISEFMIEIKVNKYLFDLT